MRKWRLLAVICLSLFVMAPRAVFAKSHTVSTVDEFKQAVAAAKDGDEIILKDLEKPKDFNNAEIEINRDLTIKAGEIEYDPYNGYQGQKFMSLWDTAVLTNISFKVAEDKTLSLSYVEIYGGGQTPVHGDGSLVVSNYTAIQAPKNLPAVELRKGTVKIEGIRKKKGIYDYKEFQEKVKADRGENFLRGVSLRFRKKPYDQPLNSIQGGEGDTKAGEAIIAKKFVMTDTSNQGFEIRGGNSKDGEGAFAILADNVNIDIRQAQATLPNILIKGGDGRYPGGAIRGTNLEIVAGGTPNAMNGIRPGAGTTANPGIEPGGDHYVGVVEVKDGGKLDLGKDIDESRQSHLGGFDQSYFYGPTILAKGNAQVNIHGGTVTGALGNPTKEQYALAPRAVIEMGTGQLNVKSTNAETAIDGGHMVHGNLEAMIFSEGDVLLSGNKVSVEGPGFGNASTYNGYVGPKRGATGIKTSAEVLVTDGARVKGGTINNVQVEDESVKNQYRTGSGIFGAKKVTISNGAIVQGDGQWTYKNGALERDYKYDATNLSTGYGVEEVKELIVDGGFVHGGDTNATGLKCSANVGCVGNGTAGSGIKSVPNVVIKNNSLVTGGSGSGRSGAKINFFGRLEAGHGIDNSGIPNDVVNISGSAKVYGGNSGTKAGHGIFGSENILVAGDARISGGACRNIEDLAPKGPAGSGIYEGTDVTVTGGTIEAGNHAFQNDHPYMKKMMDRTTKGQDYAGASSDAVAIHAKGLVLVDGTEKKPELKSHCFDFTDNSSAPAVKLTGENGTFILGKGKVEAASPLSNLVEGGRYHVDIFKDNGVNTVTPVDKTDDSQGLRYKDASTPLYRVLDKDGDKYVDATVDGVMPIEVAGYKLYAKDMPMELKFLSYGRKLKGQKGAYGFIEEKDANKNVITKMVDDNLLIDKTTPPTPPTPDKPVTPPTPAKPGGQSYFVPSVKLNTKDHFAYLFGYPDSTFRPDKSMTRAEVAAMFVRLMEKAPDASAVSFKDVAPGAWYYDYIAKAEAAGILKGYEDGSFRPQGEITRAEFAAIATRFDKLSPAPMAFTDVANDYWAHDAIAAAYGKGWIAGYEDNTFRPAQSIKRSEVAALTNQVLNRYADKDWVQAHRQAIINFTDVNESHWAFYPITEATNGHDYTRKPDGKNETWIQLNHLERR